MKAEQDAKDKADKLAAEDEIPTFDKSKQDNQIDNYSNDEKPKQQKSTGFKSLDWDGKS